MEEEGGAGTSGTSTGASDTDPDDKDPSKDKKKKNRCAVCRKKVGLTGKKTKIIKPIKTSKHYFYLFMT